MSYDLEVRMPIPISSERLLLDCSQTFSELLNVFSRFEFSFFNSYTLGPSVLSTNVYLNEIEWEACPPWLPEDKAGTYAFVTTGGNDPLAYVVAASVIIAVAQQSGGLITDGATRWIKPEDRRLLDDGYDVTCFLQALRNTQTFGAVDEAAIAVYERLPVYLKPERQAEPVSA